jgi:glycosyltransferase involved in cell wall biosynthesis
MMMRDEAPVLPQTLPAMVELVDAWTIVDTGSSDQGMSTAVNYLENTPGSMYSRPWRSFGENRTELLELARGSAEWLLVLDADMRPEYHPGFRDWLAGDPVPEVDCWWPRMIEAGTSWRLPLLLRGELEWRYVGRTHEYLDGAGRAAGLLDGLELVHIRPGGGVDPVERMKENVRLLSEEAAAGSARATFYLAQTLKDLRRFDEAIAFYKKRALMGGFAEEAWYASYMAARLERDSDGLIAAWKKRPWRAEPLRELVRLVEASDHKDILFVET